MTHHTPTLHEQIVSAFEDYLKEAIEGRAWLPKGLQVEYDENQELLITVTKEV